MKDTQPDIWRLWAERHMPDWTLYTCAISFIESSSSVTALSGQVMVDPGNTPWTSGCQWQGTMHTRSHTHSHQGESSHIYSTYTFNSSLFMFRFIRSAGAFIQSDWGHTSKARYQAESSMCSAMRVYQIFDWVLEKRSAPSRGVRAECCFLSIWGGGQVRG